MKSLADPFDSIESAHDFLTLLVECVSENRQELEKEFRREHPPRRMGTLRMAYYNLIKLEEHLGRSQKILNDLRMIRGMLIDEGAQSAMLVEMQNRTPERKGMAFRERKIAA